MGEQDTNEYASAEEKAAQKLLGQLDSQAHEGALFADWSRQYCSVRLFKWLDEQIADSKNAWLTKTSREEAEAVRLESRAYAKIKSWIYTQIKAGELASVGIKQFHNEGVEMEGVIKLPPTRE
jgi:hypothetical protein